MNLPVDWTFPGLVIIVIQNRGLTQAVAISLGQTPFKPPIPKKRKKKRAPLLPEKEGKAAFRPLDFDSCQKGFPLFLWDRGYFNKTD